MEQLAAYRAQQRARWEDKAKAAGVDVQSLPVPQHPTSTSLTGSCPPASAQHVVQAVSSSPHVKPAVSAAAHDAPAKHATSVANALSSKRKLASMLPSSEPSPAKGKRKIAMAPANTVASASSEGSATGGVSMNVDKEPVPVIAERIFERLLREKTQALASKKRQPQTIADLMLDAPARQAPGLSEGDIAQAKMMALRGAYDESQRGEPLQHGFQVVSWNIDGLDETGTQDFLARTAAVASEILAARPAVVFLQEVIDPGIKMLRLALDGRYTFVVPDPKIYPYYVVILVSVTQLVRVKRSQTLNFRGSQMGRQLLVVEAELHGGKTAAFLTSHLESTKDQGTERKAQFLQACEVLNGRKEDLVVFAGDLNLRDVEVKAVLPKFPHIRDVWEHLGSNKTHQYTWDCKTNNNCGLTGPRCRFDRMYFKSTAMAPSAFGLLGTQRLPHGRFPSDHYALRSRWPVAVVPPIEL